MFLLQTSNNFSQVAGEILAETVLDSSPFPAV